MPLTARQIHTLHNDKTCQRYIVKMWNLDISNFHVTWPLINALLRTCRTRNKKSRYKCSKYCDEFVDMLFRFQTMWGGYLGRSKIAKHCMELLNHNVQPVHSAPFRACSKSMVFETVQIDKMIDQMFVELAQTELAAPLFFAPKKRRNATILCWLQKI